MLVESHQRAGCFDVRRRMESVESINKCSRCWSCFENGIAHDTPISRTVKVSPLAVSITAAFENNRKTPRFLALWSRVAHDAPI